MLQPIANRFGERILISRRSRPCVRWPQIGLRVRIVNHRIGLLLLQGSGRLKPVARPTTASRHQDGGNQPASCGSGFHEEAVPKGKGRRWRSLAEGQSASQDRFGGKPPSRSSIRQPCSRDRNPSKSADRSLDRYGCHGRNDVADGCGENPGRLRSDSWRPFSHASPSLPR